MSKGRSTIALCAWTFVVWTTRIGNIWNDEALADGEKWARSGLAMSFTVLALAAAAALWRPVRWRNPVVRLLAGWTVAVWLVRSVGIVTGDREAAFITVHLILAAVSITLAAFAVREVAAVSAPQATSDGA